MRLDFTELRQNVDWGKLLTTLGVVVMKQKGDDWWASSPFAEDRTPSFHVRVDQGKWYCQATKQGGGSAELVLALLGGEIRDAFQWMVDNGVSHQSVVGGSTVQRPSSMGRVPGRTATKVEKPNQAIEFDLRSSYSDKLHNAFVKRGIFQETCDYLGCGFLPEWSKSPLAGRLVFQVRGVAKSAIGGGYKSVILSHIGRATSKAQAETGGKWHFYTGFRKSLELYGFDLALLEPRAFEVMKAEKTIILVEGTFDVAKLVQSGIYNTVASFGAGLSGEQVRKLKWLCEQCGGGSVLVWYDHDAAGEVGQASSVETLKAAGVNAIAFDWDRLPTSVSHKANDVCEFGVDDIQNMDAAGLFHVKQ